VTIESKEEIFLQDLSIVFLKAREWTLAVFGEPAEENRKLR